MQSKTVKNQPEAFQSREEELQKAQWEEEDRLSKQQEFLQTRTKSFEEAMTRPVSDHVEKIDDGLGVLLKDLENSRKDLQNLKTELQRLENAGLGGYGELNRGIMNEVGRIEEAFRKTGRKDREELEFFGQQMKFLKMDRNKLDESADLLALRVKACENDVGFRFVYD